MPLAAKVMQAGFSAGQAKGLTGQIAATVSAAGTTQATGTALVASMNYITTAAASSGVVLPSCEVNDDIWVHNAGANTLKVYPDSGSKINAGTTDAAISLPVNTGIILKRVSTTVWVGILSA